MGKLERKSACVAQKQRTSAWKKVTARSLEQASRARHETLWSRFEELLEQHAEVATVAFRRPSVPEMASLSVPEMVDEGDWLHTVRVIEDRARALVASGSMDDLLQMPRGSVMEVVEALETMSLASIVCAVLLCLRWMWRGASRGLKRAVARKHPRMPDRAMFALLCLISSKVNDVYAVHAECVASVLMKTCPSQVTCAKDVFAKEMELLQAMSWNTHVSASELRTALDRLKNFGELQPHEQQARRNDVIRMVV